METNAAGFRLPEQFEYRGVTYHSMIHENINLNMLDKWKVEPTDIVIASYPKSGTTWMGSMLPKLLNVKADRHSFMQVPYLEFRIKDVIPLTCEHTDELPHPRMFKTHLMYEFFQDKVEKEKVKVIVVTRNPKDTITSYYYMYQQPIMGCYPGDFHEFFQLFKNKKLEYGDIFEWNVEWWKRRDLPNIHVVKYEDLKKDCVTELQKICDFLGHKHEPRRLQEIVQECSFENMRAQQMFEKIDVPKNIPKPENDLFFRKGTIGDWKNHMNEEEVQYIEEQTKKYYEPVGLHYDV